MAPKYNVKDLTLTALTAMGGDPYAIRELRAQRDNLLRAISNAPTLEERRYLSGLREKVGNWLASAESYDAGREELACAA